MRTRTALISIGVGLGSFAIGGLVTRSFGPLILAAVEAPHEQARGKTGERTGHDHGGNPGLKEESGRPHEDDHEEMAVVRLTEAQMKQFGVEVVSAGPGILETHIVLPGEVAVNADRMARIGPRVPGVVREVRKSLGETVRQGEVMATIDSRDVATAKAEYLAAIGKVELTKANFAREEALWKKKISAEQEYLDAKQALAEARIALLSAERKLHALGFSHEHLMRLSEQPDESFTRFEIAAPFNATVVEKRITLGEVVKEDTDAFVIADLSSVWVNLRVPQKDLPFIRKGQSVLLSSGQRGSDAEGRLSFVGPLVSEETRTALARVVLPNPAGAWRPGTFVSGKVAVDEAPVPLLLPKTALQIMDEGTVVFVETEEGFVPRLVVVGRANEADVEITSGVSPGDRCVVKGTLTLKAQLSKGAFGDGHNH